MLITTTLIQLSQQQTIHITNLKQNPGLLSIETGNSFIKIGNHKLFHILEMNNYEPIFGKLLTNIQGIRTFSNFTDMYEILESKYEAVYSIFNSLLPKQRKRRGLFNLLGTGIKRITGNMDHNDFKRISENIFDLQINSKRLVNENNEQVKINLQLQNRINFLINRLNQQQNEITKNIVSAKFEEETRRNFKLFREIIKINYNLDNLKSHLVNIFESVQLAKANIIPKQILSTEELGFVSDILEKQNIRPSSTDQIYEYLELSAFYNHSRIIFVVFIPKLESTMYTQYFLEPLPVSGKILKLSANAVLQSDNKTYFIKKDCPRIERTGLCNLNNLEDITGDLCFSNLLRGLSANCTFINCHHPTRINTIMDNYIVVKNIINLEVESSCGLTKRNLSGTYLIEFHNCSVVINGTEYSNIEAQRLEPSFVMPLDGLRINERTLEIHNNIDEIHIENRHRIETFSKEHKIQTYTSLSMSTICFLLSIIAGLFWISKRRKQISLHIGTSTESNSKQKAQHEISTTRDDSSSKGGLVKIESSSISNTPQPSTILFPSCFIGASSLSSSSAQSTTTTTTSTTPMTTITQQSTRKPAWAMSA